AFEVQFPTQIRVVERATDAEYRSILGEWGQHSVAGIYETLTDEPVDARPEASGNGSREEAQPLAMAETATGRVEIGRNEDWYKFVQPKGLDLVTLTLTGEPLVGAGLSLETEAGDPVAL